MRLIQRKISDVSVCVCNENVRYKMCEWNREWEGEIENKIRESDKEWASEKENERRIIREWARE
jgi:hypothetical protein